MHDLLSAVILGIVEGVTEFLPVSSTGHLILVNQFVDFSDPAFSKMFDVVIQLGAILSVVIFFWKRLWPFGSRKPLDAKLAVWQTWIKAVIAVLPALVIGALFGSKIQEKLYNPYVVAAALVSWGIVLVVIEKQKRTGSIDTISKLSYLTALWIGFIQCLAMIPGTSRSGVTIIGAMLLGTTRIIAAEFSFFLAIPTMVAATGYSLMKFGTRMHAHQAVILAVGFIVSFLVAYAVIAAFMKFIRNHNFIPFGIYRIILGAVVLAYFFLFT
jgi:undecaprenyl-diphosphatase